MNDINGIRLALDAGSQNGKYLISSLYVVTELQST